jgi:hypothetical protein
MQDCDITSNKYICKIDNKYIIDESLSKDLNRNYLTINDDNNEIYITPAITETSNYYLLKDNKAHCDSKWQDWFCIHNYHNNNNVNKYPKTDTISIGACYNYCEFDANKPKGYSIQKYNKCTEYDDENNIIYNPLAFIAIFGTHFKGNSDIASFGNDLQNYNHINKTIGIRGSYLNDLYRVNKNDKFIPNDYIVKIIKNLPNNALIDGITNKQDRLLLQIINNIANIENTDIIMDIKSDIGKAYVNIYKIYIAPNKDREEQKQEFLNKIKNYVFDIEELDKIYGVDKNKNSKLINIIAYAHNIMRLVCYDKDDKLLTYQQISDNIKMIGDKKYIKEEDNKDITRIFLYSCFNCFNKNHELLNNYRIRKSAESDILLNEILFTKKNFFKFDIDETFLNENPTAYKYELAYYNNIPFYEHRVLSDYSENIKYIDKILLVFLMLFCIVIVIFLIYWGLIWLKFKYPKYSVIDNIILCINFSHLFYKWLSFGILKFTCQMFYGYIFAFRSKNSFFSLTFKIFNIMIIIGLLIYLYNIIMDLLNIDYIYLVEKMNFSIPNNDSETYIKIFFNILYIYFIYTYIYSAYIVKYSLSDSQFDIIANIDADKTISGNFVDYLLLSKYADDFISNYSSTYPELNK